MESFFHGLLNEDIIADSIDMMKTLERSKIRAIKSDLRRNERLRAAVNAREISIGRLLSMSHEDLANDTLKRKRDQMKRESLSKVIRVEKSFTKEEIDVLINKIEDP